MGLFGSGAKNKAKKAKKYGNMANAEYAKAAAMSKAEQRSIERRKPADIKDAPSVDTRNTSASLSAPATSSGGGRGRKVAARAARVNPRKGLR